MREITRSVKVALKCLIAVVLVDIDLPYWSSKVEHLVAFPAIVSNIYCACADIGVNSYWAQGLKPPPHFYDHGARIYDEPPTFVT